MQLQAATTIVASVIHSHYIGLDITRKLTIPHGAQLPSKAPVQGQALNSSDQHLESHTATQSAAGTDVVIENPETASACSQQDCPSADRSHHPEPCDRTPTRSVQHERQVWKSSKSHFPAALVNRFLQLCLHLSLELSAQARTGTAICNPIASQRLSAIADESYFRPDDSTNKVAQVQHSSGAKAQQTKVQWPLLSSSSMSV